LCDAPINSHERLRAHLATFLEAYNNAKRLKHLQSLTPFDYICNIWSVQPQRFRLNPPNPPHGGTKYLTRCTFEGQRERYSVGDYTA
jgi:hypothetical protein